MTMHRILEQNSWVNFKIFTINFGPFSWMVLCQLLKIVFLLIAVAYFTIAERKVLASIQRRKGPNVVGLWGLLQPLADGAKLVFKELLIPTLANSYIFLFAPVLILILSLLNWSILPTDLTSGSEVLTWKSGFQLLRTKPNELDDLKTMCNILEDVSTVSDISYGILFILAISGFNVYGLIVAGWASNSKYAFLGSLRSAAQMISYEVSLGLLLLPVILLAGSLNFTEIVVAQGNNGWFFFPLFPCAVMFFISMLAETNRAPFDLPEAEAELVAGYNVEYSSIIFAMFFLGEYTNMLFMSAIIVLLFFGGWLPLFAFFSWIPFASTFWLSFKILIFCFFYILARAGLPRFRYDQLMDLGWKVLLPLSLGYLLCVAGILFVFDALPHMFEVLSPPYQDVIIFK